MILEAQFHPLSTLQSSKVVAEHVPVSLGEVLEIPDNQQRLCFRLSFWLI